MKSGLVISIIICTRNRAGDLKETMESLRGVSLPPGQPVELVIVDNGSTDGTAEVAKSFQHSGLSVRVISEPRTGKGNAYNAGLAAAQGDVLLFSDDDVRFPRNWVQGLSAPIWAGEADALAGGVRLAKHLERPWMLDTHRLWMAATGCLSDTNFELIGANMAFSRAVLAKVPAFDPELGPGASGLGEDTLFTWQLQKAGYRLKLLKEVEVEHHFDPRRLQHAAFLKRAAVMGRSLAYLAWHWEHKNIPQPRLRALKAACRLRLYRLFARKQDRMNGEGADVGELSRVSGAHFYVQYLRERRRPRNYDQFGLRKSRS